MVTKLTLLAVVLLVSCVCMGCSIKAEFGYHGKTGRDDQTVTENFRTGKGGRY